MKRVLFYALQWTWGILQNLMGLCLFLCLIRRRRRLFRGDVVTSWRLRSSLSLGMFVFTPVPYDERTVRHEYGHSLQSVILGPLWLLAIGLPSLVWAGCLRKWRERHGASYYSFYTEAWADSLGGVGKR